jgi:transposase-like protein
MSSNSRIQLLQEAINIEKERAVLQGKLDQLQSRLARIQDSLFATTSGAAVPAPGAAKMPAASKPAPAAKQPARKRGELKQRIFAALATAGKGGMRVRDLAIQIGVKQEALHSWFQFARKNISAIRKAGKGRYRLVGAPPKPAPAATKPASKAKPATAAKKKGSLRGKLSHAINTELKAAGKDGVRVADLAKKFSMKPRNLFVWFSTTAKKFPAIKKIAPGHYSMEG